MKNLTFSNEINRIRKVHKEGEYLSEWQAHSDHASAALGKWLKNDFDGLKSHCLSRTFRDRLRPEECPLKLID